MPSTSQYILEIIGKDKTGQAFKQVQTSADKTKQSILNLKNAIIAIGTGVAIRSIINTTARFEDLRTSLRSVTGSAESGAQAFDFIQKFATKTQFGIEDLTETFIKLKAAGITPTEELLTTFTDTAAITTDQIGSLQAITDLFARSISGGLGLEDLNRLADRGVPVFRILEEQLGLTRLEVSKFGQTAEGANKIREALVKGLDTSFGGATAERVKNLSTRISNLQIAFTNAQDSLGRGLNQALGETIVSITELIEKNDDLIVQFGEDLGNAIKQSTEVAKTLVTPLNLIKESAIGLIDGYKTLPEWVQTTGVIGALLGGRVGFGILVSISAIAKAIKDIADASKIDTSEAGLSKTLKEIDNEISMIQAQYQSGFIDEGTYLADLERLENYKKVLQSLSDQQSIYHDHILRIGQDEINTQKEIQKEVENTKNIYAGATDTIISSQLEALNYEKEVAKLKRLEQYKLRDELEEIEKQKLETQKQAQSELITKTKSTLSILAGLNKDAFRAYQAYQIAEATINAYKGATNALATYPPPYSFLVAAASVAQGLAMVAQIRSQNYSGRALGGRVQDGSAYMVGEQGPEMFVPNQSGTIIPNNKMGSATNVNITINANDTQGFDDLLVKRRSVIVNVINDALNSQGREALI